MSEMRAFRPRRGTFVELLAGSQTGDLIDLGLQLVTDMRSGGVGGTVVCGDGDNGRKLHLLGRRDYSLIHSEGVQPCTTNFSVGKFGIFLIHYEAGGNAPRPSFAGVSRFSLENGSRTQFKVNLGDNFEVGNTCLVDRIGAEFRRITSDASDGIVSLGNHPECHGTIGMVGDTPIVFDGDCVCLITASGKKQPIVSMDTDGTNCRFTQDGFVAESDGGFVFHGLDGSSRLLGIHPCARWDYGPCGLVLARKVTDDQEDDQGEHDFFLAVSVDQEVYLGRYHYNQWIATLHGVLIAIPAGMPDEENPMSKLWLIPIKE